MLGHVFQLSQFFSRRRSRILTEASQIILDHRPQSDQGVSVFHSMFPAVIRSWMRRSIERASCSDIVHPFRFRIG